ncbi:hypothetical protein F5X99DRAFT_382449 [Biscogniauxia marginata]|nr:hypothetical protein F5X99DRAFT_382449 [Biscogniauxia marginata]
MSDHRVDAGRSRSPPRRQRACLPCTKAKARCNFKDNKLENGCDRCRRMQISCAPQMKRSLRRPRQVKSSQDSYNTASPVGQAAGGVTPVSNINYGTELFSAGPSCISSSESPSAASAKSPQIPTLSDRGYETLSTVEEKHQQQQQLSTPLQQPTYLEKRPQSSLFAATGNAPSGPGFGINWNQAEEALSDYKSGFMPQFPFVALDPDISAHQVFSEKPLLFRVIMLVAARLTLAKQREIKRSIDAYIGQHMLVMKEQDIGMLQGLIAYIAWGHHEFYMDRKITQLVYLAAGYVHSLGITHHPYLADHWAMVTLSPNNAKEIFMRYNHPPIETSHTLEERRAFLGCFYVLSINSLQFGRRNAFRLEYVSYCLESLGRSAEYRTDFHLIKMMEFRQFTQRIAEEFPGLHDLGSGIEFTVEVSDKMKSLRAQLDQLFENVSREHPRFVLLWITHLSILVRLYLPATYMRARTEEASSRQLQHMLSSLQVARSFFATLLSLSPERLLRCPFISLTDMSLVIVASARLLLVEIDGWNLQNARQILDFPSTMDDLVSLSSAARKLRDDRIADAAATYPSSFAQNRLDDESKDPWVHYIEKIKTVKAWYGQQIAQEAGGSRELWRMGRPPTPGSVLSTQSWNHFFLGLLGNDSWNFDW